MASKRGSAVPTTGPGTHTKGKSAPGMSLRRKAELKRERAARKKAAAAKEKAAREEQKKLDSWLGLFPVRQRLQIREKAARAAKDKDRKGPYTPIDDARKLVEAGRAQSTGTWIPKLRKGGARKKPTRIF